MTDEEYSETVRIARAGVSSDPYRMNAFDALVKELDRLRGLGAKPPVPGLYTAVDFADRAKELRERARKYRDGKFDDVAEAVEADAKMMDYAAALAAIRYDAKQLAGDLVYDINHCGPLPGCLGDVKARCQRIWETLAHGEENR